MNSAFNIAHRLLHENLRVRGDKIAVFCEEGAISYRQLAANANRFDHLLDSLPCAPGDRVVIALPDCCEFFYAFLGSILHGAWPVLVNPGLTRQEYAFFVQDCEANLLVTTADSEASRLEAAIPHRILLDRSAPGWPEGFSPELDPHPCREDDIAFMLYSSGSTGKPKGVPHRHADLLVVAETYGREVLHLDAEDVLFSASKLFFAYGLGNSLAFPLSVGAAVVLLSGKCTPAEVLGVIAAYRPSLFFAVPTLYNVLLRSLEGAVTFPSLRLAVSAGEALPVATSRAWKAKTGLELLDGFGSTEAMHIVISNRPGDVRPGSSGRLVPPFEAKIVDEAGRSLGPGQPGRLLIRGKSTAPSYWRRPEKTRDTMLEDGWLSTGDVFIEQDGYYTYQGRSDDMFKVEAQWLSPTRVEDALRDHSAVFECAVTSRKLEGTVRPVAFVVPAPGVEARPGLGRELIRHAAQTLPAWMCPVQVVFCAEIPKTSTGKLQRFRLRLPAGQESSPTQQ